MAMGTIFVGGLLLATAALSAVAPYSVVVVPEGGTVDLSQTLIPMDKFLSDMFSGDTGIPQGYLLTSQPGVLAGSVQLGPAVISNQNGFSLTVSPNGSTVTAALQQDLSSQGSPIFYSLTVPDLGFGSDVWADNVQAVNLSNSGANIVNGSTEGMILGPVWSVGFTVPAVPASQARITYYSGVKVWTPILRFGGSSADIQYNNNWRWAVCVRTGHLVDCGIGVQITNKGSATGAATVVGLPWQVTSSFPTIGLHHLMELGAGFTSLAFGVVSDAGPVLTLTKSGSNQVYATVTDASFQPDTLFEGGFKYFTLDPEDG